MKNARVIVFAAALVAFAASCGNKEEARAPDPAMVMAHSQGFVAKDADITVVLSNGRDPATVAGAQPFRLSPEVSGSVSWSDDGSRATFRPDTPLSPGRRYRVVFDFASLGEPTNGWFSFDVTVERPSISVVPGELYAAGNGLLAVDGVVRSEGIEASADVERLLEARLGGSGLALSWIHEGDGVHRFTVKDIVQTARASTLSLSWNGERAGAHGSGTKKYTVPAEGSFELLSVSGPAPGGPSCVSLHFSKPLDPDQDLRGLIRADRAGELRYEVDGGVVKLYASLSWPEETELRVERGVRSADQDILATPVSAEVSVDWELPEVRFAPGGVIVPSSQGTRVVLETRNLATVYVEAVRVYGNNMLQFLQVNDLDGSRELKRVGDVVWSKEIDLAWTDDRKNQWVPYALDLSPLLAKHPDGMFQLRVAFSREHIRYVCKVNHPDSDKYVFPPAYIPDSGSGDESWWDYYEGDFDWNEYYRYRDDPCHPSFYINRYYFSRDRSAKRNVLVSDVGIMARKDAGGQWHITASDLKTARPLPGAQVALYSYSLRELARGSADANGQVVLKQGAGERGEPYFVVAEAARATTGRERGYLKLTPSSMLAVSHFDVGGQSSDAGVKGYLYGERGVWRPGDDMHLVFILYDRLDVLPEAHPVTFELVNPLGQVTRRSNLGKGVNGFYYIKAGTDASAPTGTWTARVSVGGRTFTKDLKVETVMPNRLKLSLDYGDQGALGADLDRMSLSAAWLHGAPAPGLKADVSMVLATSSKSPGSYAGYNFQDPTRSYPTDRQVLFDGYLDDNGVADFSVYLGSDAPAPGPLSATFLSRAFEQSGLFSSEMFTADFHPYPKYVGLKLPAGDATRGMILTDKDHPVEIIMVGKDGKPVSGSSRVQVSLYKLEWRWWWEKGEESLAEYAEDVYRQALETDHLTLVNGRGTYTLRVNYPEWGRYLLRVRDADGGHAAASVFYMDWPGWAGRSQAEGGGGSAVMLSLSADKTRYNVGDTIKVSFPSNKEGRAYVVLERSGQVLEKRWVDAKDGTTTVEFKASAAMAPNVYAHVSFLQPHLQTANDLPIRLYGVVPIMVEDPLTRLQPVLDTPTVLAPNTASAFTVSERSGRPMTYTVAVVDEGLLGITRFSLGNPWDQFFKKEASNLSSYDMYKDVAGAFTGKLQTLLGIGGSEFGDAGGNRKVNRFPPVVRFFGPFTLGRGEKRTHEMDLGPYVGAVRFMAVAGSPDGAYGIAQAEVPVKTALMAFITAPRVLGPGEKAVIPVSAFGFLGKNAAGILSLKVEGAAELEGSGVRNIVWKEEGEEFADFTLKVKDQLGSIRLTAELTAAGGAVSTQTVDIPVRSQAVPVSALGQAVVPAGGSGTVALDLPGLAGSNEAWLELSLVPPIDLSGRLGYLIGYPHGCGEQTVSKAFPQLFLPDAVSLGPKELADVKANVISAVSRMADFQTANGGFAFWPGGYEESQWLSAYVTHFLVMAKRQGYTVAQDVLQPALDYLKQRVTAFADGTDHAKAEQSYRLYVLALAGSPDIAGMNRLLEYGPHRPPVVYQLASAYALAGMKSKASELVKGVTVDVQPYAGMERVYGSVLRDKAVILEAFNQLGDTARGLLLFKDIAGLLSSNQGYSTQSLSYALMACLPFIKTASSGTTTVSYSYGGKVGTLSLGKTMARVALDVEGGSLAVKLENKGKAVVYARVAARGTPKPGSENYRAEGLALSAGYQNASGKTVDPNQVATGDDIIVVLSVRNTSGGNLSDIALTFRSPSGWEISNMRVGRSGADDADSEDSQFDYQDIRDDRVMTYFGLGIGETKSFRIYVNKTYAGTYFLPAVTAEAMYKPDVFAVIPGRELSMAPVGRPATTVNTRNLAP
ncbi:MAG: Ig-like domain-containing protein [Spirochaetia bacterium]|nr:Ig-like domain-containing protein [Spirochaetia bacterium]